ncbi:MAG: two-component system, OmpR family, sensor kinase [Chloroflexota bacterium]|jgi:two-component system OmpR family sensor kinase|nr:two-component system, OmpR family, sensor kinase [Chloroflexota bacterium]
MSLRLRVTLLTCGVVALVVLVIATVFFITVGSRLRSDLDNRVVRRAEMVDNAFSRLPPAALLAPVRRNATVGGRADSATMFSLGHPVQGGGDLDLTDEAPAGLHVPARAWVTAPRPMPAVVTLSADGVGYTVALLRLPAPVTVAPAGRPVAVDAVAVGASLEDVDTTLRSLVQVVILAGLAGLLVSGLGAWLAAGRGLRPITLLSRAMDTVGRGGDLSRRVPVRAEQDEVAHLTTAFNHSLDRVEAAYHELERLLEQQQRFVADASHELRTPLTTVRTDIEVMRRHPGLPAADRDRVLDNALTELRRLSQLVGDLLTLASADARTAMVPSPVNWDELVRSAADEARRICDPRPVSLSLEGTLGSGVADQDALQRTFVALFENIAHHTPIHSHVWVSARDGAAAGAPLPIEVRVEDDGPGVSRDNVDHLFDRFFQADPSRHSMGTGLGLAIARSLVEAHGGHITAGRSRHGGLALVLSLPRVASDGAGESNGAAP